MACCCAPNPCCPCENWPLELPVTVSISTTGLIYFQQIRTSSDRFELGGRGAAASCNSTVVLTRTESNGCYLYRFSGCGSFGSFDFISVSVARDRNPEGGCYINSSVQVQKKSCVEGGTLDGQCGTGRFYLSDIAITPSRVTSPESCTWSGITIGDTATFSTSRNPRATYFTSANTHIIDETSCTITAASLIEPYSITATTTITIL